MNLIDPANLPKSTADGPETYNEAFGKLASSVDMTQRLVENTNSDQAALEDIYSRRINRVEELTGQKLENPISQAHYDANRATVPSMIGTPITPTLLRDAYRPFEDKFGARVSALEAQYPALAPAMSENVDDQLNRERREAEQKSGLASLDPNLDPVSRFAAQMAGGLMGAARDPFQWQMAVAGGGSSGGATVAGRIGRTMLTEGLVNGGQEAVLQAASQERKKAAGLEYGMNDALANVGLAATFGALFGGTVQGGHELARIYKMGNGGAEVAARVLEGNPQPGDVETMAKAMGVDLHPEQLDQLNRSFEERVLDEHMVSPDASPEQQRVFDAARRYAEDPDNNPPPEIVERAIADESAGPARTLTADDYERIYGGDPDAIDDLHSVIQAESLEGAARIIDDETRPAAAEEAALPEQTVYHGTPHSFDEFDLDKARTGEGTNEEGFGVYVAEQQEVAEAYHKQLAGQSNPEQDIINEYIREAGGDRAKAAENALEFGKQSGQDLSELAHKIRNPKGNVYELTLRADKGSMVDLDRPYGEQTPEVQEALDAVLGPSEADRVFTGGDFPRDVAQRLDAAGVHGTKFLDMLSKYDKEHGVTEGHTQNMVVFNPERLRINGDTLSTVRDPLEGQTIRPAAAAEPVDDAAMRAAEEQAGEILAPEVDANGNPRSLFDFVPIEDRDGNVRLVSTAEALEIADQGNLLAEILEACKL